MTTTTASSHLQEYDLLHLALFFARPLMFYECQPERWNPALDRLSRRLHAAEDPPHYESLHDQAKDWFITLHNGLLSRPLSQKVADAASQVKKGSADQPGGVCPVRHYVKKQIELSELALFKPGFSSVERLSQLLERDGVEPAIVDMFRENYQASLPIVRENLRLAMESQDFHHFFQQTETFWRITGYSATCRDPLKLVQGGIPTPPDLPFDPDALPEMTPAFRTLALSLLHDRLEILHRQWHEQALPIPSTRRKDVCGPLVMVSRRESRRPLNRLTPLDEALYRDGMEALTWLLDVQRQPEIPLHPVSRRQLFSRITGLLDHFAACSDWVCDRALTDKLLAISLQIPPTSLEKPAAQAHQL